MDVVGTPAGLLGLTGAGCCALPPLLVSCQDRWALPTLQVTVAQRPLGAQTPGNLYSGFPRLKAPGLEASYGQGWPHPPQLWVQRGPHRRLQRPPDRRALPAQPASPSAPSPESEWTL